MNVVQSGNVTPGHLVSWTTDGIVQDAGVTFTNSFGLLNVSALGIDFNKANTDTEIVINLPVGFTRYRVDKIILSGATATLSTATCGVFTATAGGGIAVVTGATAVTVTQTAADTNHNMQSFTINNQDTMFFNDPVLYFRVQGAQGSAALGNVTIEYESLP